MFGESFMNDLRRRVRCAPVAIGLTVAAAIISARAADREPPKPAAQKADNSLCYVCHLTMQTDEITVQHLAEGIGCEKCHGSSHEHMHDEMLTTKPDRLYGRKQVDAMCGSCHDKPHEEKQPELKAFLEKWRGRDRPNGRAVTATSICTDCHGTHVVAKKISSKQAAAASWVSLFNGRDLAGWKPAPSDNWRVDRGRIVGRTRPEITAADLWGEDAYADFVLSVTFRQQGAVKAGIWLRGQPATPGLRVEILAAGKTPPLTGSVHLPGKGLVLVNVRDELLDDEGWNTLVAEVRGGRTTVRLNGEEIGAVVHGGPREGRIGLHAEGPGDFVVREILIQRL
jgi:hypothetical protein